MKFFKFLFVMGFMALCFNGFSQINVNSSGKVGINKTSPVFQLDVSGDFRVYDAGNTIEFDANVFYSPSVADLGDDTDRWSYLYADEPIFTWTPDIDSDLSFKKNVRTLAPALSKVMQMRPVKYQLKERVNGKGETIPMDYDKVSYGFIAQEMQEVIPEVVNERENGKLGIRYTELISVLTKAMQEQQEMIKTLKNRVEALESMNQ